VYQTQFTLLEFHNSRTHALNWKARYKHYVESNRGQLFENTKNHKESIYFPLLHSSSSYIYLFISIIF